MVAARGWGDDQFACLVSLWNAESGWRVNAGNKSSGAYGIPQALPGSKMASAGADWQTNPATQITWGLGYISGPLRHPLRRLRASTSPPAGTDGSRRRDRRVHQISSFVVDPALTCTDAPKIRVITGAVTRVCGLVFRSRDGYGRRAPRIWTTAHIGRRPWSRSRRGPPPVGRRDGRIGDPGPTGDASLQVSARAATRAHRRVSHTRHDLPPVPGHLDGWSPVQFSTLNPFARPPTPPPTTTDGTTPGRAPAAKGHRSMRARVLPISAAALALVLAGGTAAFAHAQKTVTLDVDGKVTKVTHVRRLRRRPARRAGRDRRHPRRRERDRRR